MKEQLGTFFLEGDRQVFGQLKVAGKKTRLKLHDRQFFRTDSLRNRSINGTLHDLTSVSLIDCWAPGAPNSSNSSKGEYYYAKIRPAFVITGDHHIDTSQEVITNVMIFLDDSRQLFCEFEAYGSLSFDATSLVDEIRSKEVLLDRKPAGPNAKILYYLGNDEIVRSETVYGTITVAHRPNMTSGDRGGSFRDQVAIHVEFPAAVSFYPAIDAVRRVTEFVGLISGRPQNLMKLYLRSVLAESPSPMLKVEWCHYPSRKKNGEAQAPTFYDALIDAVRQPEEFSSVIRLWLQRQALWQEARWRFFSSFATQNDYHIDRLVASANMFDILPGSAVPNDSFVTSEVEELRKQSRLLFRKLPPSLERDSVLGCLGRLGKSTLKHKVWHRALLLHPSAEETFPSLQKVLFESINCRNFFVHGTPGSFDYGRNPEMLVFFTDTLEFVFAVSDLIEAEWDFGNWLRKPTSTSHPFGRYKVSYPLRLQKLLSLSSRQTQV